MWDTGLGAGEANVAEGLGVESGRVGVRDDFFLISVSRSSVDMSVDPSPLSVSRYRDG